MILGISALHVALGAVAVSSAVGGAYVVLDPATETAQAAPRTAAAEMGVVLATKSATGNVSSPSELPVSFAAGGTLVAVPVEEGQRVKAGQVLARVDDRDARLSLRSAEANLRSAQARLQQMLDGLTDAERQQNATLVAQSQASLETARISLSHTKKIAKQDRRGSALSLSQAEAQLGSTTAQLDSEQKELAASQSALAAARSAVDLATATLDEANAQLAKDKEALASAQRAQTEHQGQANQNSTSRQQNSTALSEAKSKLQSAQQELQSAQQAEQAACSPDPTAPQCIAAQQTRATAQAAVNSAQADVNAAQARVDADTSQQRSDQSTATADALAVQSANNAVSSSQTAVSNAQSALNEAQSELVSAENGVTQSQSSLESLESKATADRKSVAIAEQGVATTGARTEQSIASAERQVRGAELSLTSTRAGNAVKAAPPKIGDLEAARTSVELATVSLEQSRGTLEETTLRAPVGGTVAAIVNQVGETVGGGGGTSSASTGGTTGSSTSSTTTESSSSGGFITLTDLDTLTVLAGFSETDAAEIRVGQTATVNVDALPGTSLAAGVIAIDTLSTVTNNVVTYDITVALLQDAKAVKPGMSATVEVIVAESLNALAVPSSAVSNGVVTVLEDEDVRRQVPVVTGLKGDTTTEIVSGIREGDRVVLPSVSAATAPSGAGAGFPGGGGGFPGGGGGLGGGLGGGGRG